MPESNELSVINPKCCPVCGVATSYVYRIEESSENITANWYRCHCGVCFQENFPAGECYDDKYAANYQEMKEGHVKQIHAAKIYAPLIEELTYGRQILDVGYATGRVMNYFEDRGWITFGIDVNKDIGGKGHLYKGNFENYNFDIALTNKELVALAGEKGKIERKFDLIWMSHVFEHFNDPVAVIKKAHSLLSETGVIYIACPDIDFMNKMGASEYPHWKAKEHYTLWTESALKRELERAGFKIVMSRRNFSSRFASWFDVQIIAQKNYF